MKDKTNPYSPDPLTNLYKMAHTGSSKSIGLGSRSSSLSTITTKRSLMSFKELPPVESFNLPTDLISERLMPRCKYSSNLDWMSLCELSCRRHVHAHPSQCLRLAHECFCHLLIRSLDQRTKRTLHKLCWLICSPCAADRSLATTHRLFEVLVLNCCGQVSSESCFTRFVDQMYGAEAKL